MENVMTLGDRIRAHRELKGWKQRELAAATGKDGSYISMIENDQIPNPSRDTIEKFSHALDCTPNDLLGFPESL